MKEILPDTRADAIRRIVCDAEAFASIEKANLDPLLERISGSKIVLLGESTHGTSEFYQMRSRITLELIRKLGFNFVAIEAGWAEAEPVDQVVRGWPKGSMNRTVLNRFGSWMWKNREFSEFIDLLKAYNLSLPAQKKVAIYGLDVYGIEVSIDVVLDYLQRKPVKNGDQIRELYAAILPWKDNMISYGSLAKQGRINLAAEPLYNALKLALEEPNYHFLRNMRLVQAAEEYYRTIQVSEVAGWNMRDKYMFEVLESLLAFRGSDTKAVVWAHNSHLGHPKGSDLSKCGYLNLCQLCCERFPDQVYKIGFGFHSGTLAAAPHWGAPLRIAEASQPPKGSYEDLFHECGVPSFFLPLRKRPLHAVREVLLPWRFERGIGLSYEPSQEAKNNLYNASLPEQFDEYCWFDRTSALSESDQFPNHSGL
ncbi:MAG: erythromycin esterase family protein [Verrucomicrobia bacterium]|nr:erythromycin esterase family protein [Verrucomicrobiota bacterium]